MCCGVYYYEKNSFNGISGIAGCFVYNNEKFNSDNFGC